MSPVASPYVGADVAQDSIAFCGPTAATVKNEPAALRAYLRTLPPQAHLICEATGRHHRPLQQACAEAARPLSVFNPARARAFAGSLGQWEKTDPLDAALLRRLGQERQPAPTPPPAPELQALLDLLMLRSALVADLGAHRCRDLLLTPLARRHLRAFLRSLQAQRAAVERSLSAWLDQAPADWQDRVQTLCLVVGVGVLSALQLLAYVPELGDCNRRQIAKLCGLAPLACDSGLHRGQRHLRGGRSPARRVLYQCAVVAARYNDHLRPVYLRLRAHGKPAKVAYLAVARKLVIFLNALLRPTPAGSA